MREWSRGKQRAEKGHFDSIGYIIVRMIPSTGKKRYSLFVCLDPQLKTLLNLMQHPLVDLKCQAEFEEFDELHEMFVVLVFLKPSMQYNWSNIECPNGPLLSRHL